MPAVKLVNFAASVPDVNGEDAQAFLHQKNGDLHSGKPLPRDPTATRPHHDLGPVFTLVGAPTEGCVFDGEKMVWKAKLTADDQSRLVRHEWAQHSDSAMPAFVLPHDPSSKADIALANAIADRFNAKAPTEAQAEDVAKAYQLVKPESADAAYAYYLRGVGVQTRVWVPGQDVDPDISSQDLIGLLAATEQEHWEELLAKIEGPTAMLLVNGRDNVLLNYAGTATQAAQAKYMSLSATATAPVVTDTTFTGEITTTQDGTHGLGPGSCTFAHTNGTASATRTVTHTGQSADSYPLVVAQVGFRTANSGGGSLTQKIVLGSTATLSASGDALTTTTTDTLS